jgi:hypothetical protein
LAQLNPGQLVWQGHDAVTILRFGSTQRWRETTQPRVDTDQWMRILRAVDLTMAVVAIIGWSRLMVSFRMPPADKRHD